MIRTPELLRALGERTGGRWGPSVPALFIKGEHVKSTDGTLRAAESGELLHWIEREL